MAKAIFNVFFGIIKKVVELFLTPINLLVVGLFPNLATIINAFNNAVQIFLGGGLSYFFNLIPPTSRLLIQLYLSILIAYYGIIFSYHTILKVIHIIKKIKVW